MDSSNIDQLISMADKAMVDFSDSDLSGNLGDRSPVAISTSNQSASAPAPSNNPSPPNGTVSVPTNDLMKAVADFTDSMADSLDSPDVPPGIRLPQDPIDSVSSTDTSRISNPVKSNRPVDPSQSRAPQVERPRVRPPMGGARPPLRMPNPRPTVEQTMRNIANRHNLQNGPPRPNTRPVRPGPQSQPQPQPQSQVHTQVQVTPAGQDGVDQNPQVSDQNGIVDPNQPINPQGPDQNGGDMNMNAVVPPLPDHMTSLMGYSIPTATLYLILILVLIAVALYFWTAPPAPKKDKDKKKQKKDEEEDDE